MNGHQFMRGWHVDRFGNSKATEKYFHKLDFMSRNNSVNHKQLQNKKSTHIIG